MSKYNPIKYLDHKIYNLLVFLLFHLLRELHVKSL
jgi:hypothetical protein